MVLTLPLKGERLRVGELRSGMRGGGPRALLDGIHSPPKGGKATGRRASLGNAGRVNGQCSKFNVQCSKFKVQSSMFKVQCSMFNVQCSMFKVQCPKFVGEVRFGEEREGVVVVSDRE